MCQTQTCQASLMLVDISHQDIEDLQSIAKSKLKEINWDAVQSIIGDKYKTELIKKDLEFLAKSST